MVTLLVRLLPHRQTPNAKRQTPKRSSIWPKLAMQPPENTTKKEHGERIDHERIENENIRLPAPIVLLRAKEDIVRLGGIIFLLHLRVRKHVGDLAILVQLFGCDLLLTGHEFRSIEWSAANDAIDLVQSLVHLARIFTAKTRQ
jgi:hypothetical protein